MSAPSHKEPIPQPAQPVTDEIDQSCRVPLLFLFAGAVFWFLIGNAFDLLASLKFHQPAFLADTASFTYGRAVAVRNCALLYGFALPSALGTGLWLLCRLGQTRLAEPRLVTFAALFWNISIAIGLLGILAGGSTGYEAFEMPGYTAALLLVSWLLAAGSGVLTLRRRNERQLFPSQRFVAGALFWFAWIFATACLLLLAVPARGVLQAAVAGWYAHNLNTIVLGFSGLASIFFFIPKLLNRPLRSAPLATFAFWTLALFGGLGGISSGAPFPAWMASLSIVGTVLTAIPLIAVAANMFLTTRRDLNSLDHDITLRCSYAALTFWLVAGAQAIVSALPSVGSLIEFTTFTAAQKQLWLNGFFGLAAFGAVYHIAPCLLQREWPFPKLIQVHFWLLLTGIFISYIVLVVGGIGQGILLANPKITFPVVMKVTLHALRFGSIGATLILLGHGAFLLNFATLTTRFAYQRWTRIKADLTRTEARS